MVTCRLISSREEIEQITDYIALTIETTGRHPETDKIIEIGMVQVAGDRVVNKASTYIDPEMPIPGDATLISGIADEDVAGIEDFLNNIAGAAENEELSFEEFLELGKLGAELFDLTTSLRNRGVDWREERDAIRSRMTDYAGIFRSRDNLIKAIGDASRQFAKIATISIRAEEGFSDSVRFDSNDVELLRKLK